MTELSTFGATSNTIEQAQNVAANTQQQAAPANNEPSNQPAASQQPASTQPANNNAQPAPEAAVVEAKPDSSDFALSLGDEGQDNSGEQQAAQQHPIYNWKDEIKKLPFDDVIAELGVDPFAVEINKHIKSGGQPIDYLQARAIDYTKISDDTLLKESIRKEYPNLSPSQVDLMFHRKYNVPEDATDEDKEFYTAQLQADAYKVRQNEIAKQQRFKVPETPIPQKDEAYDQWKQNIQSQAQQIEERNNYYLTHPATKSLNESKRVTINLGEGVAPFNFQIDKPEMLTKAFTDDGSVWRKLTSTPQGEPDVAKQQLIALISYNPQKFIQDIFKYGQSMGEMKKVEEGQNAQKPQAKVTQMSTDGQQTVSVGKFGNLPRN